MSTTIPSLHATDASVHVRYIRNETLIAVVINSLFSALFTFLVFGRRDIFALWGSDGLALDFVPQTFIITLMTVIAATLLTRKRVRGGDVLPLAGAPSRLPSNVVLRALLLGVTATIVLGGLATLLLVLTWQGSPGLATLYVLKIAYGAIVAAVVAPVALRAALRDVSP